MTVAFITRSRSADSDVARRPTVVALTLLLATIAAGALLMAASGSPLPLAACPGAKKPAGTCRRPRVQSAIAQSI